MANNETVIPIKVETEKELIHTYLTIFNGINKLTKSELILAEAIVEKYIAYQRQGLVEPFISKLVLSSDERKAIRDSIGCTAQVMANRLDGLVKKGIIVEQNNQQLIHTALIPKESVTFKFNY